MKKFELTTDTKMHFGRKLFRIKALVSFGDVKEGTLGGYVEKEENLDHEGNAWVYGDALVYGDARVSGNACVYGEENGNGVCKSGVMHFCENPFDVLDYYPLVDDECNVAEFAEVEALGDTFKKSGADDKTATNKLHIGAKLNLKGFIKACIDFSLEKTKVENKSSGYGAQLASSGDYAQLASSGNYAQLASSGYCAQLASSGNYAQLASSGNCAQLASSGDYAQLASSGNCSQLAISGYGAQLASSGNYAQLAISGYGAKLASSGYGAKLAISGYGAQLAISGYGAKLASSGDYAQLASSGDGAKLASSGNCSQLASSGYGAQLASSGNDCVVCVAGIGSIAKAKVGSWITLSEWRYDRENRKIVPACVKTEQVDGERIKEDTFYKLENGEFVEVK